MPWTFSDSLPSKPNPEFHIAEVFNSNVREVSEDYSCYVCDSDENARRVIIIDSGCSSHMFFDSRVCFEIFVPRLVFNSTVLTGS